MRDMAKSKMAGSKRPKALTGRIGPKRLEERTKGEQPRLAASRTNKHKSDLATEKRGGKESRLPRLCSEAGEPDVVKSKASDGKSKRLIPLAEKAGPMQLELRANGALSICPKSDIEMLGPG